MAWRGQEPAFSRGESSDLSPEAALIGIFHSDKGVTHTDSSLLTEAEAGCVSGVCMCVHVLVLQNRNIYFPTEIML